MPDPVVVDPSLFEYASLRSPSGLCKVCGEALREATLGSRCHRPFCPVAACEDGGAFVAYGWSRDFDSGEEHAVSTSGSTIEDLIEQIRRHDPAFVRVHAVVYESALSLPRLEETVYREVARRREAIRQAERDEAAEVARLKRIGVRAKQYRHALEKLLADRFMYTVEGYKMQEEVLAKRYADVLRECEYHKREQTV